MGELTRTDQGHESGSRLLRDRATDAVKLAVKLSAVYVEAKLSLLSDLDIQKHIRKRIDSG